MASFTCLSWRFTCAFSATKSLQTSTWSLEAARVNGVSPPCIVFSLFPHKKQKKTFSVGKDLGDKQSAYIARPPTIKNKKKIMRYEKKRGKKKGWIIFYFSFVIYVCLCTHQKCANVDTARLYKFLILLFNL